MNNCRRMLMKPFLSLVAAFWVLFAGGAQADSPVVVELYTSQGCSSCPPADRLFAQIADRDDVIALALHVDYWDYLGWKDEFGDPANTARQRSYARAAGKRTVYTPQMVIGGVDHIVGSKPMDLTDLVRAHARLEQPAEVSLVRRGGRVTITVTAEGAMPGGGAMVQLATYLPRQTVEVRRGENAGRKLAYHNIVRNWIEVGRWTGRGTYRATVQVPAGLEVAVIVQEPGPGRILGAAKLN